MLTPQVPASQRGQWSLIGTLVAVAILIALAALFIPKLMTPAGPSASEQSALQEANGVACTEYVSEMNQAVLAYKTDHDGQPPSSIADLEAGKYGVTPDMVNSPGCSFQMDPATGTVTNGAPRAAAGSAGYPGSGAPSSPGSGNGGPSAGGPGGIRIPTVPDAGGGM